MGALSKLQPAVELSHRLRRSWMRREFSHRLVGTVRLGSERRLTPLSRRFGFDRGTPVDRWYIEDFLSRHAARQQYALGDIRGRILEVGGSEYSRKFGDPAEGHLDVLHVDVSNAEATIVGDLESGSGVPEGVFDCIICTQTLHVLYDIRSAVEHLHAALRPGGVVLATFPGITPRCTPDADLWGDYWRLTSLSARRLFEERFPAQHVRVEAYGNLRTAVAFLRGMTAEELSRAELDLRDRDYEVLIAVRAAKVP